MSNALIRETSSPEETLALGEEIGRLLRGGELVLLSGPLGAGKSVFARGVARALGSGEWRGSPTFNLVHEYATKPLLYHADLYRLTAPEAAELGLEEYAGPESVLMVEWADRAIQYLHSLAWDGILDVTLRVTGPTGREVRVRDDRERQQ